MLRRKALFTVRLFWGVVVRWRQTSTCTKTAALVTFGVLCQGCQSYHPLPLDRTTIECALRPPSGADLRLQAAEIQHPVLQPIAFDAQDGLSPDESAVLAVLANPMLRAARATRKVSAGQVLQAGILPNPELSLSADFPDHSREPLPGKRQAFSDRLSAISGRLGALSYAANATSVTLDGSGLAAASSAIMPPIKHGGRAKLYTGSNVGLSWEITSLITRPAEIAAAEARASQVDLDIAWQEWQVAQAAKIQTYKLASLREQLEVQREIEGRTQGKCGIGAPGYGRPRENRCRRCGGAGRLQRGASGDAGPRAGYGKGTPGVQSCARVRA